ncbi:MAG TPA: hypothetical protein OIM49_06830 [Clostridiaceae bacterium]|nr:hypothetical protein [Clostridiaceae bacterium]
MTFIICIIILLSGCKKSEEKPNIDDKISAEIQYLDKEISGFIDIATGKNEKNYDVQKEKAKTGVSNKNTEDSNSKGNSEESSEEGSQEDSNQNSKSSNQQNQSDEYEVTIMSMKYNSSNKIEDSQWDELKNSIEKLYTSWTTIENDLNLKDNIQKDNITNLNKNFDNLLLYAINKDEKNFIKESIESYANITNIADQVEYEKNKLYKLQSKNKIFEAYYNVQENDWISAKNNINLANSYLEKIENLKNRVKVSLKNLSNSVDQNDETVFYIKYEDLINEINYIDV